MTHKRIKKLTYQLNLHKKSVLNVENKLIKYINSNKQLITSLNFVLSVDLGLYHVSTNFVVNAVLKEASYEYNN